MKDIKFSKGKLIFSIFIALILISGYMMMLKFSNDHRLKYNYIYDGIYIEGINVSGLSEEQAYNKITAEFSAYFDMKSISLLYDNKKWVIPLVNINYQFDIEATVKNAYQIGREGSKFNRIKTIKSLRNTPVNLILPTKYDDAKLLKMLSKIKKEIDFSAKPSTYNYNYGRIMYTNEVEGRNLDIEKNKKRIDSFLLNRICGEILLDVSIVKPAITVEDVKDLKDILGNFTTSFNKNNYNRSHNIELACKKMNNYLLKPGEEFSMNLVLGPRTSENGYMQAPIIVRNNLVSGTGGGICQVASTLYNSILMSMLQVTSRVNHSLPPTYVSPGRDATIAEGYIDFKFKNNRDYTICIVTEINGNAVTVKVIGRKRADDPEVVLKPVVVAHYDPPEPEYVIDDRLPDSKQVVRKKSKRGMKVILYRETYKNGLRINTEKISEDIYKPLRGEIAVNKKTYQILNKLGVL